MSESTQEELTGELIDRRLREVSELYDFAKALQTLRILGSVEDSRRTSPSGGGAEPRA